MTNVDISNKIKLEMLVFQHLRAPAGASGAANMAAVISPAYRIGDNGKLYFKFNQGAEYTVTPLIDKPFVYKILSCKLDELTGKEYYRIQSAGKELPSRFSIQQVELLLAKYPCTTTAAGEPQELPLLLDEVQQFYTKKRKELSKANKAENAKLKGTEWNKNLQARAAALDNLDFYRSQGNAAKVAELEKKLAEIEAELNKILTDKGVDLKILTKQSDCEVCNDTGVIDGQICACARPMANAIKLYCAAKRLARG